MSQNVTVRFRIYRLSMAYTCTDVQVKVSRKAIQPTKKGRKEKPIAAPSNSNCVQKLIAGRDRVRPSRVPYASGVRLRPTTCGSAPSNVRGLRAVAHARVALPCFPIRGVLRLHAADGPLSRVAAGMYCIGPEVPAPPRTANWRTKLRPPAPFSRMISS